MPIKSELEHPRPGHAELVAEGTNVRRYQPQILGDEWQTAQPSLHRAEELGARTWHPLAGLRRRGSGGYVPGGGECAEMVQADRCHVSQQGAQAVDGPAVTGTTKRVPVIDGVAPELSLGAEVVRRHTGNDAWSVARVQQEQLRVGPHIARIRGNEKRQVADQAHALGMGMVLQALRLTKQQA